MFFYVTTSANTNLNASFLLRANYTAYFQKYCSYYRDHAVVYQTICA